MSTSGKLGKDFPVQFDQPVESEHWMGIAAAIIMAVVGIAYFLGMPVIIGLMVDGYGLTVSQAGYLSSIELAGTALASVLVSLLIAKTNRRSLLLAGLLLAIAANLTSAAFADFNGLMVTRFMAGIGSGIVYATGIALLAATTHSTRNFSILIFVQVSLGTLELYALPTLVNTLGVNSIFLLFAFVYGTSLLLLPLISNYAQSAESQTVRDNSVRVTPELSGAAGLGLLAIFAFYLTVGSFWAFVERYGIELSIAEQQLSELLTIGNIVSLLGCVIAYLLSRKNSAFWPLVVALLFASVANTVLGLYGSLPVYAVATFTFMICWNVIDITQLSLLGELDPSGRMVALAPAFQAAGTTLGPAMASTLLAGGLGLSNIVTFNAVPTFSRSYALLSWVGCAQICAVASQLKRLVPSAYARIA